jgi:antirestriction protein
MNIRIYVGTYAKYNSGSLKGAWIDLEGKDAEDFEDECRALHSDEHDPEFMFQDWEDIPRDLISECHLDPDFWVWMKAIEKIGFEAAFAGIECEIPADEIAEAYYGHFSSDEDFAQEWAEETGALEGEPSWPFNHIDWEWAAADLMQSFAEYDGYYFRSN